MPLARPSGLRGKKAQPARALDRALDRAEPQVLAEDFAVTPPRSIVTLASNSKVKRSVFLEDWVFSIAHDRINVAHINNLANPVASIDLF